MLPRLAAPLLFAAAGCVSVPAGAAERPVVVELFTSEGCSSCPPADALLTAFARSRADVLPLAFHVTYWNGLGWADPFSFGGATERQARYGARFGDGSYTPEMVIDGAAGVVGSDRGVAEAAIATARRAARDSAPCSLSREGGRLAITVGAGPGRGRLTLVGYDREHRTAVGRGENTGRTLTESNIVRSVRDVGAWTGAALALSEPVPAGELFALLVTAPDGRIIGASRLAGGF